MKQFFRVLLTLGVFLTYVLSANAAGPYDSYAIMHEKDSAIVENFSIWYKVDSIDINPDYLGNKRQIEHIIHYLENSPRIDSITIYAWASPEGRYSWNQWLSRERARSAKKFLLQHSPDSMKLNAGRIRISPIAENWQGLTTLVEENYTRKDRQQVLDILYDQGITDQTRKLRLQKLDAGRSWRYLIDNYMPQLRAATWICVWVEVPPMLSDPGIKGDTLYCHRGTILTPPPAKPVLKEKKMILAPRTNLLVQVSMSVSNSRSRTTGPSASTTTTLGQFPDRTNGAARCSASSWMQNTGYPVKNTNGPRLKDFRATPSESMQEPATTTTRTSSTATRENTSTQESITHSDSR